MCPSFTIGFTDAAFDERKWARAVAERYGTGHHERVLQPHDADAALERLMWHFDEPFSDHSFLPTYCLAVETRRQVGVALSGDGADEAFAGYRKYSRTVRRVGVRRFVPDRLLARVAREANHRLHPASGIRQLSAKYGYDPAAMVIGIFTPGLTTPALETRARGPLAAALRHYHPREVITRFMQKCAARRRSTSRSALRLANPKYLMTRPHPSNSRRVRGAPCAGRTAMPSMSP